MSVDHNKIKWTNGFEYNGINYSVPSSYGDLSFRILKDNPESLGVMKGLVNKSENPDAIKYYGDIGDTQEELYNWARHMTKMCGEKSELPLHCTLIYKDSECIGFVNFGCIDAKYTHKTLVGYYFLFKDSVFQNDDRSPNYSGLQDISDALKVWTEVYPQSIKENGVLDAYLKNASQYNTDCAGVFANLPENHPYATKVGLPPVDDLDKGLFSNVPNSSANFFFHPFGDVEISSDA